MADLRQDPITGQLILQDINLEGSLRNEYWYTPSLLTASDHFQMTSSLDGLLEFSLSFDISTSTSCTIYTEGADGRFIVSYEDSFLRIVLKDATGKTQLIVLPNMIDTNTWTNITFTRSNTTISVYKNGELQYSEPNVTGTLPLTSQDSYIGSLQGSIGTLVGSLAFVTVFTDDLTASEALLRYNDSFGLPYSEYNTSMQTKSSSSWDMTSGTRALDQAGTNHLTENAIISYSTATRLQATALQTVENVPITKTLVLTTGLETIAQRLRIRLLFFLGEWVLDVTEGTPWYQRILIKGVSAEGVDSEIKSRILNTTGITNILQYTSSLNSATRTYTASFRCSTDEGTLSGTLADGLVNITG